MRKGSIAAIVLYATIQTISVAQLPISLSGSMRLFHLTNPDAPPLIPDPQAPAAFLEAYGFVGTRPPLSYPVPPIGANHIDGTTARITFRSSRTTVTGLRTIFYVTSATAFQPVLGNPNLVERTLSGEWALFIGDHLAPAGTLRGQFDLRIEGFAPQPPTAGTVSGALTITSASGALGLPGASGAVHDLTAEPAAFPNWLGTFSGPPANTGGDLMLLAVAPRERRAPATLTTAAPGASSVTVADLDGDDRPEVIVAETLDARLRILFNDGHGSLPTAVTLPTGAEPVCAQVGFLDADGHRDLVIACRGASRIEIRSGLGAGSFAPPLTIPLPLAPSDCAVVDLDDDGRAEIVCALPGNGFEPGFVRILENDGTGAFPTFVDVTFGLSRPTLVTIRRNAAPGRPDLFVTDGETVFTPQNAGLRLFDLAGTTATFAGALVTGPGPRRVSVADLDLDDGRDLVLACFGDPFTGSPGSVKVFKEITPGVYAAPAVEVAGIAATDVAVADYDRNGRADALVAALDRSETTLLSDWDGATFASMAVISLPAAPSRVTIDDLSGDGFPDLLALSPGSGTLATTLAIPRAQGETYGTGCAGTFGIVPRIATGRYPNLGNLTYSIQVRSAFPSTVAALFMSFRPRVTPLPGTNPPGCSSLIFEVAPHFIPGTGTGQFVVPTDAAGFGQVLLPIPPAPTFDFLQGLILYAQWAVIDPLGTVPLMPPLALSDGLRLTIY